MIDPRRQDNHIVLPQSNPDPLIALTPNIEKPLTVQDIPDLLVLVQVFVEEHLDLLLVDRAHLLRTHGDLVAVLVRPVAGDAVHAV